MTGWEYLGVLLLALACLAAMDRRLRLFLWDRPRRAALVLAVGVVFFLVWDLSAIGLGIYGRGGSAAMTGIELAPHLPLEEVFFVTFLCYLTMVAHPLVRRFVVRPADQEAA
ncbi:lycopene cyclase domain-containing protein [Georgenia sp. SYP-B2076]|uniref:lycopene cyclase domain-containing protein n=1 Tax=Georgenia sp. SYP-B2076 TaxID=2495881 RepID=UPI000F8DA19F|nr:lycopene cyclase domain-containing protein [Georgenia sp. SYP-B2076]